ncbi:MAG: hypothetical protein IMY76_00845 [Chloroflexi bacterium]|nr:hypothetical protein [Chloroflexota bacterium]
MDDEKKSNLYKKYLKWLIPLDLTLFLIIGLIWWLTGEHTIRQLSDISFFVGASTMMAGFLVYAGTRQSTGNFRYQFANTASDADMHKRINQDWKERFANEALILFFIILGGIPLITGILIYQIFT